MARTRKREELPKVEGVSRKAPKVDLAALPAELERRVLDHINRAHLPEDLVRNPQVVRDIAGEHGREYHHALHRAKDPWRQAGIDGDLAKRVIQQRPPYGYIKVRDLLGISPGLRALLDWLIRYFSASRFGEWSAPIPISVGGVEVPIQNAALLKTGEVILLPDSTDTLVWDPSGGASPFRLLNSATTGLTLDLFCSGHSFLSDGKLLAIGGGGGSPGSARSNEAWKFDPDTETWTKTVGDMAHRRWYPTVLTLGDEPGRALVASGWTGLGTAPIMEVYSETTDSFTPVTVSGPVGEKIFPQTYPGLHMLPGGEIFYAPAGFGDCSQSASPYAGTESSGYFLFDGSASGRWTDTGANVRTKGMSVLLLQPTYPFVRVLVVGGGDAGQSETAQMINLSSLSPAWGPSFPLLEPRIHPNVVLLPDGSVFICGGIASTGVPPAGGRGEMLDPAAGTLTEMAALAYPRHYHSVALLLPSGQVMVAGGASDGGCSLSVQNTIEVFSPPYLFRGARPTMSPLPPLVHHGESFDIDTPEAPAIARVVLVRPMAVTHQTDSEQRVVSLSFLRSGPTRLRATMPNGLHPHGMAPRGHYLLFILDDDGVPSVGQFVYLH